MRSSVLFITFLLFSSILGQNIPIDQLRTFSQADVVLVIDQATPINNLLDWSNTLLSQLEEAMLSLGLNKTPEAQQIGILPLQNRYGLVLFGSEPQPRRVLIQGKQFVPLNTLLSNFRTALESNYISAQPYHDGYLAMQLALDYPWRSNAHHIMHFITPRWRYIMNESITHDSLTLRMQQLNIVLDIFTNCAFMINAVQMQPRPQSPRTFGLHFNKQERTAYYLPDSNALNSSEPQNVQSTANIGRIDAENSIFTVMDDYIELIEHSQQDCQNKTRASGSAFDLRIGLTNMPEFNRAFVLCRTLELLLLLRKSGITPQPQPIGMCPLPTGSYVNIENSTFYINGNLQNLQQANQSCQLSGGVLADINERNVNTIAGLAASNNIDNSSALWVNSWNTHTYGGTPLVLVGNNVMAKDNVNDLLSSICQITPANRRCLGL